MKGSYVGRCVVLLLVLVIAGVKEGVSETCDPAELTPCAVSLTTGQPPSGLCCTRIQSQQPCLCSYLKNPDYSKFINSDNAKMIANACKLTIPKC